MKIFQLDYNKICRSETCTICNIQEDIKIVSKKYAEREYCKSERGLKRYFDNKKNIKSTKDILWKNKQKIRKTKR